MKKLCNFHFISELVVPQLQSNIAVLMRNYTTDFVIFLGLCKDYVGNRVNLLRNSKILEWGYHPGFDIPLTAITDYTRPFRPFGVTYSHSGDTITRYDLYSSQREPSGFDASDQQQLQYRRQCGRQRDNAYAFHGQSLR